MQIFNYQGVDLEGKTLNGQTSGNSMDEVRQKLTSQGIQLIDLKESASAKKSNKREKAPPSTTANGVKIDISFADKLSFIEQLSDLLGAGITIDESLKSIASAGDNQRISELTTRIHKSVTDGNSLSNALSQTSNSFDKVFCNLVAASEESGSVPKVLERQVVYLTRMRDVRSRLANTLIYPAFLVVAGIGVFILFTFFLLPKLSNLISTMGANTPLMIRFLMGTREFCIENWPFVVGIGFLLICGLILMIRLQSFRNSFKEFCFRLPVVGKFLLTKNQLQYFETLGNLTSNGLPLSRSIEMAQEAIDVDSLKTKIQAIDEKVKDGVSLSRSLSESGLFHSSSVDMIRIGEKTGQIPFMLNRCAEKLDRQFSIALERLTALMQPIIILIMALAVGGGAYMMLKLIYSAMQVMQSR